MIVADTDVLIDYLRGHERSAKRVALEIESGHLATTAITAFELRLGAKTRRQQSAVALLLDALVIAPLDAEAAECAAEARRALLDRGEDIGVADSLIAGICLARGNMLLTHNRAHFERVAGLKLATTRAATTDTEEA
jgi:tRNA(fMet)-specific endonuclease VapC